MSNNIVDPFYRELHYRMSAQLDQRIEQLAAGHAKGDAVSGTAEKYAGQVSYIKALRDVLEICGEIEKARYPEQARED